MARRLDGREIEVEWSDAVPMTPDEARVTPGGQVLVLPGERGVRARELAGVRPLDAIEPLELRPEAGPERRVRRRAAAVLPDGVELPAARRAGSARAGVPPRLLVGVGAWSAPFAGEVESEAEVLWLDPLACGDAAPDEAAWYGSFGPAGPLSQASRSNSSRAAPRPSRPCTPRRSSMGSSPASTSIHP